MKRIYLISAALILLAIITADIYLNKYRSLNTNNNVATQATPAKDGVVTTNDDDNIPSTAPVIDNNTVNEPVANISHSQRYRRIKHHRHYSPVADEYRVPVDENAIALNVSSNNNGIGIETPKSYYAHTPAAYKQADKVQPTKGKFHLPENINPGLEIGYNQSSLSHNQTPNIPVGNVNAALLVNFRLGDHLNIEPGIRYISMGNRLQDELDYFTNEKLLLHYLQLPVNLIWEFGQVGNARLMVGAGPYIGYLVNAKDKFQTPGLGDGSDVIPASPQYNVNNINKFDWGLGGFIGCQSPDGLFAKAGGEAGMMDIIKGANSYSNHNYNFMVSIGYLFGGK